MSFRNRLIQAWETGEIPPDDGWSPGKVETQAPQQNEGSQTPPAHDRDGVMDNPEDAVYEWQKKAARLADRYLEGRVAASLPPAQVKVLQLVGSYDKRGKTFTTTRGQHTPGQRSGRDRAEVSLARLAQRGLVAGEEKTSRAPQRGHVLEAVTTAWHLTDAGREVLAGVAKTAGRAKTAGEVRFIKDRSGDEKQWGWGMPGPHERELSPKFEFKPGKLKPLATALRASLAALGHAMSAYQTFTKIKSATVSPDGSLGGKGYIQKIAEMRRQYMNVIEALSALTDTIYDEVNASHWDPAVEEQSPREREQVQNIMEDAEEIRDDPEGWAEEEESEMDTENKRGKKAHRKTASTRVAEAYLARETA